MPDFANSWTVSHQAPLSLEFCRQEYWSALPFPSPGVLPDPGIKPRFPVLQTDSLPSEPPGKPQMDSKHIKIYLISLESKKQKLREKGDIIICLSRQPRLKRMDSKMAKVKNRQWGASRCLCGQESACQAGDSGLIPESGRSPGDGNGNPLQYSCLGDPMNREAWLQSIGSQRTGHDLETKTATATPTQAHYFLSLMVRPFPTDSCSLM